MGPNIIQQESRMRSIPDAALRQMLIQMTQTGQVGTPEYLLAAGEIQSRKDARAKAAAGQGNPTPIIADLLTGGAMPPQMPMLPENAGGVAALPAPNMDNVAEMAAGGIVAFSSGGSGDIIERETREIEQGRRSDYSPEAKARMAEITRQRSQADTDFLKRQQNQMISQGRGLVPQMAAPGVNIPVTPPTPSVTGMPTGTADFRAQMRQADNAGLAALAQQAGQLQGQQGPTVKEKPDGAAPAAAPVVAAMPQLSYEDAFKQAQGFAEKVVPGLPAEEAVDPKKMIEARNKLYKDLNIEDPTKLRREQLDKEIKNAKSEKEQAGWMRLAEFGFNWASQNGPALQAAAKAGAAVMPGLMSDLKDLRKLDRDQQKELAGLAALDAQAQRTTADSVLAEIEKKRERRATQLENINNRRATVAASVAGNVISSQTSLATAKLSSDTSLQTTKMTTDATLARLAEQLAETETKNIIDAATTMVTKRMDYAGLTDEEKKTALLDAVRTIKEGRRLAGTTVTPR